MNDAAGSLPDDPVRRLPPWELIPETIYHREELAESRDWGHGPLGLEAIQAQGYLGEGVVIAICDTGIDAAHPDLAGKVIAGRDFTGGAGPDDRQGHGTHVAGIACAASNGDGVIGAAPAAKLIRAKVLGDDGSGASSWIAAGMKWAADQRADIISLSLGGPQQDPYTAEALDYCVAKGCWVTAAAGNDGRPATSYPGHYPKMVAVAAIGKDGLRAPFSTQNAQNDVATPGVAILSTLPGGRYGNMSGTSMATPYVAGCLALVRGAIKQAGRPMPTQIELLAAIKETSTDIAPTGPDADTGAGLLNTAALIARFVGSAPPNPPAPPPPDQPPVTPPPPGGTIRNFGISFGITTPWSNGTKPGSVASGTFSIKITGAAGEEVPQLEPILANILIPVPKQPVEVFGLKVGSVPPHTLTGTVAAEAEAAAPTDWLATLLARLCEYGPQLPQPLNHALALLCWFLKQQSASVSAAALPPAVSWALRVLCQAAPYLPAPYGTILSLVCRIVPFETSAQTPCGKCP